MHPPQFLSEIQDRQIFWPHTHYYSFCLWNFILFSQKKFLNTFPFTTSISIYLIATAFVPLPTHSSFSEFTMKILAYFLNLLFKKHLYPYISFKIYHSFTLVYPQEIPEIHKLANTEQSTILNMSDAFFPLVIYASIVIGTVWN